MLIVCLSGCIFVYFSRWLLFTFYTIPLHFNTEPATERGGHEVPTVRHHRPEKRRLRLDLLLDVQDGNLLGHQTSSLGAECKNIRLRVK